MKTETQKMMIVISSEKHIFFIPDAFPTLLTKLFKISPKSASHAINIILEETHKQSTEWSIIYPTIIKYLFGDDEITVDVKSLTSLEMMKLSCKKYKHVNVYNTKKEYKNITLHMVNNDFYIKTHNIYESLKVDDKSLKKNNKHLYFSGNYHITSDSNKTCLYLKTSNSFERQLTFSYGYNMKTCELYIWFSGVMNGINVKTKNNERNLYKADVLGNSVFTIDEFSRNIVNLVNDIVSKSHNYTREDSRVDGVDRGFLCVDILESIDTENIYIDENEIDFLERLVEKLKKLKN